MFLGTFGPSISHLWTSVSLTVKFRLMLGLKFYLFSLRFPPKVMEPLSNSVLLTSSSLSHLPPPPSFSPPLFSHYFSRLLAWPILSTHFLLLHSPTSWLPAPVFPTAWKP